MKQVLQNEMMGVNTKDASRKEYMRNIYSKYWITAREKKYGFSFYDKNLCNYILEHIPQNSKILDVAIGTGYPFAAFFDKKGYIVYGVDIAPKLINKCRDIYPNIKCEVGDAENLKYPDNKFDAVYCFHSTWYFPNIEKAIEEMVRVARSNGMVIFDIQNRNNPILDKNYRKKLAERYLIGKIGKYLKNIIKTILRRGWAEWSSIIYETPTYPANIYSLLNKLLDANKIKNFKIMGREADESLRILNGCGPFEEYPRLIFVICKK